MRLFVIYFQSLLYFGFPSHHLSKMSAATKNDQRHAILLSWKDGIRTAKEIHARTNIPMRTIYDNLKKLEETGTIERAKGSGRPKKITESAARAIGQYLRKDSSMPTRTIATKLANNGVEVSHSTISRHLSNTGYSNS